MKISLSVIFVAILFLGLSTVNTKNSEKREIFATKEHGERFEKQKHLLLDTSFESEDSNTETEEIKSKNKESAAEQRESFRSRQIRLPDNYNKLEIPKLSNEEFQEALLKTSKEAKKVFNEFDGLFSSDDGSLLALVDVNIRYIKDIDENDEEITVELDFIVKWVDPVIYLQQANNMDLLNFESDNMTMSVRSLDPIFLDEIWKPDIFIERVVSISRPRLITRPVRLLISSAGLIILATRVTVKMDCGMEFHYFPADTQSCVFRIRSYSHTTKDLKINWDRPGPFLLDPSAHNYDVKLDIMESVNSVEAEGLIGKSYSEAYRVLQFKISARRKLSYHLQNTYLTSACLILTGFLSFMIPVTMVESRVAISMTTMLTLVSMFGSIRENTPIVSYVRAIDIWMVVCITLVFLTLLELAVLTWRRHLSGYSSSILENETGSKIQAKDNKDQYDLIDSTGKSEHINVRCTRENLPPLSRASGFLKRFSEQDIEKYSFIILSLASITFNIVYWPWLLISAQYFNWTVDYTYNASDP